MSKWNDGNTKRVLGEPETKYKSGENIVKFPYVRVLINFKENCIKSERLEVAVPCILKLWEVGWIEKEKKTRKKT